MPSPPPSPHPPSPPPPGEALAEKVAKEAAEEAAEDAAKLKCQSAYVASSTEATDEWCENSCANGGCPEDAQKVCECGVSTASDQAATREHNSNAGCLSISVDKTNDECDAACGIAGDCRTAGVSDDCKCGDDAVKPHNLKKAAAAAEAREKKINEEMSTTASQVASDNNDALHPESAQPGGISGMPAVPTPVPLPEVPAAKLDPEHEAAIKAAEDAAKAANEATAEAAAAADGCDAA